MEPPSSAEKEKLAEVWLVGSAGADVIVVVGPAVSTVQAAFAAVPVLPAVSVARTSTACAPSARPVSASGEAQAP